MLKKLSLDTLLRVGTVKIRIICIGNRLLGQDAAALGVHDYLAARQLPPGIDLIEGGLAGLNLLPFLEEGGRVVFVDAVCGFAKAGSIVILKQPQIVESLTEEYYSHTAGLPYLLSVLPRVCEGEMPNETILVGLEGECNDELTAKAATLSLKLATNGLQGISK